MPLLKRSRPNLPDVLVSVVVRLVPDELDHGRFVGQVEVVATGEQRVVRTVEEFVTFCQQAGRNPAAGEQLTRGRRVPDEERKKL